VQKKKKRNLPIAKTLIGLFVVALIAFGGFYFVQYQKVNNKYQDLSMTDDQRNQKLVNEVAKIIDLPKDEKPALVSKVADKAKLNETKAMSAFYEKAINGDVILAFQKANISIIYRPSEKRVIKTDNYQNFLSASNVISIGVIAPNEQQSGLVTQLEKFGNVQIVSKTAPKVLNGQSYVVDLTGANAKTAQDLATQLGVQVGALPEGEAKPTGALFAVVIAPSQ
jgi:hypothetical protein